MAKPRHFGHMGSDLGLIANGPLVTVTVVPHRAAKGHGTFAPVGPLKMMVDTGATHSWLDQTEISKLGVPPIRFGQSVGIGGKPIQRPVYRLALAMQMSEKAWKPGDPPPPSSGHFRFDADIWGQTFHAGHSGDWSGLLGRDFLRFFEFHYDGQTGTYTLTAHQPPTAAGPSGAGASDAKAKAKARQKAKQARRARRGNR